MTARDHFTRYQRPSADHMPLAYGEVAEMPRRSNLGPWLAVTSSFLAMCAFVGAIAWGLVVAIGLINGGS